MQLAVTSGQRVEDESQQDEVSEVFANPDGTWTSETAPEPVRALEDGEWQPIDTNLVETSDGAIEPSVALGGVQFSGGGDRTFATVDESGTQLKYRWTSELPEPTIEGNTAIYRNVMPYSDLVLTATPTGFTHSVVIRKPAGQFDELSVPVSAPGAQIVETESGGVEIQARDGDTLVESAPPLMWDSSESPTGDPQVGDVTAEAGRTASGTPEFTLTPDQDFLSDPDTVYPVTVDPAFTTYTTGDTWVQNKDFTSSQSASQELRVGTNDGGSHKARSYLKFATSNWDGKQIVDADLVMRNFQSSSCQKATIRATRITENWTAPNVSWSSLPATTGAGAAEVYAAKGFSTNCPTGDAVFNVTEIVKAWASGTPNYGIRLAAGDETDPASFRKYRSSEYSDAQGTTQPKISVTYNSYPATPTSVDVTHEVWAYARTWVRSTTPTLSAIVKDADPGTAAAQFEVTDGSGTVLRFADATGTFVGDGQRSYFKVPAGVLEDGGAYQFRVRATDGTVASTATSSTSLRIDTGIPGPVSVSSTDYPDDGQWHGNANQPGEFVFTPDAGDATSIRYWFGDGASTTVAANGRTPVRVNLSPPSTGRQMLHVEVTVSGDFVKDAVDYSFLVGQLEGTASATFVDQVIQEQFPEETEIEGDDVSSEPTPALPDTVNDPAPDGYVEDVDPAKPEVDDDLFKTDTLAMPSSSEGMVELNAPTGSRRAALALPRGQSAVPGTLGDSQAVIYPNTGTDTDTIMRRDDADRIVTGHLLRSAASDRSFRYSFALGSGEKLLANTDDEVAVVQDAAGGQVMGIEAVPALDATGASIPVELTQSGSDVVLTLSPAAGQSLKYPILLSPVLRGSGYDVTGAEQRFCIQPQHIRDCFRARDAAKKALAEAQEWVGRYRTQTLHYGYGDAYRHCYWNVLLQYSIGHDDAYDVASRHESESRGNDKVMDLFNNKIGRYAATEAAKRSPVDLLGRAMAKKWCQDWAKTKGLKMVGSWTCPYPANGYNDNTPLYGSYPPETCIGPA